MIRSIKHISQILHIIRLLLSFKDNATSSYQAGIAYMFSFRPVLDHTPEKDQRVNKLYSFWDHQGRKSGRSSVNASPFYYLSILFFNFKNLAYRWLPSSS